MRSRKSSQSSATSTDSSAGSSGSCTSDSDYSYGQDDYIDQDVMCLVYPDGRTTTVTAQSSSS